MIRKNLQQWMDRGNYFMYEGKRTFYIHEGKGPTILIIHGYPYGSYEWCYLFERVIQLGLDLYPRVPDGKNFNRFGILEAALTTHFGWSKRKHKIDEN